MGEAHRCYLLARNQSWRKPGCRRSERSRPEWRGC